MISPGFGCSLNSVFAVNPASFKILRKSTDRSIVEIQWRPDQTNPVSATNPQLQGNVQLLKYGPKAKRGDAESFEAEFTAADDDGLVFVETAGP